MYSLHNLGRRDIASSSYLIHDVNCVDLGSSLKSYVLAIWNKQYVLLETGGPNNSADVALYTKTRQMSPPIKHY
jgi:hypothetical protein